MTDRTDPGGGPADTVQELTGREDGVWNVVTRDSVHRFDFTAGTVTRIPGPNARTGVNDVPRPLKRIHECRVSERGYWTMYADVGARPITAAWDAVDPERSGPRALSYPGHGYRAERAADRLLGCGRQPRQSATPRFGHDDDKLAGGPR